MKAHELTSAGHPATSASMRYGGDNRMRGILLTGLLLAGSAALGGCITVNAPDKPIVIELNINIRQEVIYRLAADAGNTIDENEDIF